MSGFNCCSVRRGKKAIHSKEVCDISSTTLSIQNEDAKRSVSYGKPQDADEKDVGAQQPCKDHSSTDFRKDPQKHTSQNWIAVCGLALRLPNGIRDADTFWEVLLDGKDMRSSIPSSRYDPTGFPEGTTPHHGYFLDEDLGALDTSFFNMRKNELQSADPQQRQLLEVTRECFENAGETNYRGKTIGCYVGTFGEDWQHMMSKDEQNVDGIGSMPDCLLANRISYEFDLQGPSIVVKTGCSASLIGLHEACRALQHGDCDGAIVAGSNIIMTPMATASVAVHGVLSPEGSCKTFDASADGYARGEAINAIYIKRFDDALRDNSPIRAVIRGTGSNCDGRGEGPLTPNGKAHEALIRRTYATSGLDPQKTAYVECHGTGTPTGDPIETTAIGNVFGDRGVIIGSVKPNVGHSEGASGITSLIKAILALEHRVIPPNIKFKTPNPRIPFAEKRLIVPIRPMAFPIHKAERISVSSYGIGGSNAHVIIESAHHLKPQAAQLDQSGRSDAASLLLSSGNTRDSAEDLSAQHVSYFQAHPSRQAELAYTLATRREKLPFRKFAICKGTKDVVSSPVVKAPPSPPNVAMVFTGQGSQWPQMAYDLCHLDRGFREDMLSMNSCLHDLKQAPSWDIFAELQKSSEQSKIHTAQISQPICTAVQIALVNMYARCGVRPVAVIGHSSGEIAAAYAAGNLTMREAIIIAYYRGYVTSNTKGSGGMLAVGLGAAEVSQFLREDVVVACENSPASVTLSGPSEQLQRIATSLKDADPDCFVRELKVDMAYHSRQMEPLAIDYLNLMKSTLGDGFIGHPTSLKMFSTVFEKELDYQTTIPLAYWCSNLVRPVLFNSTTTSLLRSQTSPLLLEVGPHSALAGPLRTIAAQSGLSPAYISTLTRGSPSQSAFLSAVGKLYQHGVSVSFDGIIPTTKVLTDLPIYPWKRTVNWSESRISKEWRSRKHARHPLLGLRILESSNIEPAWRLVFSLEQIPWLRDHQVRDDVVFPLAGFVTMAGEAAQQLTGMREAYQLRHVVVHTALVLQESRNFELHTTLRTHRLTNSSKSKWFEFSISSLNKGSWTEHCHGQVRSCALQNKNKQPIVQSFSSSEMDKAKFYSFTGSVGLKYGPEFQMVETVNTSRGSSHVDGRIHVSETQSKAPYLTHPSTLDCSFQLMFMAFAKGDLSSRKLYVPTMIESLYVSQSAPDLQVNAWTYSKKLNNGVDCVHDGATAISLRGIQFAHLPDTDKQKTSRSHMASHLQWTPHFDFVQLQSLMEPQDGEASGNSIWEEATLLCIIDVAERLRGQKPYAIHFQKYQSWLEKQARSAAVSQCPLVPNSAEFSKFSAEKRQQEIQIRFDALSNTPAKRLPLAGLKRLYEYMPEIVSGEIDPLELLLQDNVLTEIYNMVSTDCGPVVQALSNKKPNLRVLEVGAGTGGTTAKIFSHFNLEGTDDNPPFARYTFTDLSAGFFDKAKERFHDVPNMDYQMFDISKDPLAQGFEAQSYDLIIAANCVHTTPSLKETLQNLQCLLQPDGHLMLAELSTDSIAPGFVFGVFSGWWMGDKDNRHDSPTVSLPRWNEELTTAGFDGIASAAFDYAEPYQYCATILAQPSKSREELNLKVDILCVDPSSSISQEIGKSLQDYGYDVSHITPGEGTSGASQIISTVDLESPLFDSEHGLTKIQHILRYKNVSKFLWLLPPCQIDCEDPSASKSLGVLRTARAELGAPITTLEISISTPDLTVIVRNVFEKIRPFNSADRLLPDVEYAYDDGMIKVGRFHPVNIDRAMAEAQTQSNEVKAAELRIQQPGLLDTLKWFQQRSHMERLLDDEVEIETRFVGLNFKDLALALGLISSDSEHPKLGLEVSGIVRRVGAGVTNVSCGDRVMALYTGGLFASLARVPALLAVRIPDNLSFEDAATMPICFGTVMRALIEVGHLQKNQSILIHSACGGVGQVAVQLAQRVGAQIYATVGSKAKADYLTKAFGIPTSNIFSSRDDSFVGDLMSVSQGKGADLVLNSLGGELLHASWKCVAEFGQLIELGNRDLAEHGKLDLEPFLENRTYACIDYGQVASKRPELVNRMFKQLVEMWSRGEVRPVQPITTFDASEIQTAFRFLQKGDHMGKAIIRMPQDMSSIKVEAAASPMTFDGDATYLITGGFGGLGQGIMRWMYGKGARQLLVLSSSAGSRKDHKEFIQEMKQQHCEVVPIRGNVQDQQDVNRAIAAARGPIKGVIHLAMVLKNASILGMQPSEWDDVIKPKCVGAMNLHNGLASHKLDFFLLASSVASQTESSGQGNYAAANTYLESFCQYRHSLGLPASVINISPIEDAGYVAENEQAREAIENQGFAFLTLHELLQCVELAINNSHQRTRKSSNQARSPRHWYNPAAITMGLISPKDLHDSTNQTAWRQDRRMGFFHNVKNSTEALPESAESEVEKCVAALRADAASLQNQQTAELLAAEIGKKIFSLMLKDAEHMHLKMSMQDLGLDSLMAIELKRWWRQVFGMEVSVLEIMGSEDLLQLGQLAVETLKKG